MSARRANDTLSGVRELQRTLYRAAKRSPTRRFHALYDKIYRPDVLAQAWKDVRRNRGAAGIDGQTIAEVEAYGVRRMLDELQQEIRDEEYRPKPVRRVLIPKGDGRKRPLGIPTVKDRIVQAAAKRVIEPIFEADFQEFSFGFRPRRSAHDAVEEIRKTVNAGYNYVVDADIERYFDSIDHDKLMALLGLRVSDRRVLKLLKAWLRAGVMSEGEVRATTAGTPQGGVVSPVLSNIYLDYLDRMWRRRGGSRGKMIRYADDFVILCRSEKDAKWAYRFAAGVLGRMGLTLNSEKTQLVGLRRGAEGFDFLGFHFRKRESYRWRGKWYLQHWPRKKAMKAVRAKVRALTGRSTLGWSVELLLHRLNPILRGWGNYFRVGNSSAAFSDIDRYVTMRLCMWLSRKHKRRWSWQRWTSLISKLPLVRLSGTVSWKAA